MNDAIEVKGLRVLGLHGVLAEEKVRAQPFEIDLRIETDFHLAAVSDDIAEAIDYGVVIEKVASVATDARFALLETLAEIIAATVLQHPRVLSVTVSVRKLRPPVPFDVATVGVTITRQRAVTA